VRPVITLDPKSTALVLIDLQKGILGMSLQPRSGTDVERAGKALAERFRAAGAPVVLVHVGYSPDMSDALKQPTDIGPPPPRPPGFSDYIDGLVQPGDLQILKRQWGAFYGTELDLQLRRRGVRTIVLGGVSTNFGVESTARQAFEQGYAVIIVEDVTAATSTELQELALRHIFPRIARVSKSDDIAFGT
jgi:nicotinamidase-related amidase